MYMCVVDRGTIREARSPIVKEGKGRLNWWFKNPLSAPTPDSAPRQLEHLWQRWSNPDSTPGHRKRLRSSSGTVGQDKDSKMQGNTKKHAS